MTKKLCMNCRWFENSPNGFLDTCKSPMVPPNTSHITGEKSHSFCMVQRGFDHENTCGTEGKFFEKAVYTAETKKYDPDEEHHEDFDTLEQAFQHLRDQQKYGSCRMWINNESVVFAEGKLVFEGKRL